MDWFRLRVLYRQFLFRVIDLELLAPRGDVSKLLGQFAALLITISFWVLLPAVAVTGAPPSPVALMFTWAAEHFLVATTMLIAGLFAVLSWDSMFPDHRDVMILLPLPVKARTIFLARIASVATALSISVICLNIFPGIAAPFAFSTALTMPATKYDSAVPPVSVTDLKPVLDRDMRTGRQLDGNTLAIGKDAGIATGVVEHGVRRVWTYGSAAEDSIFQIGSITKTFTGLLLAQMVAEGKVQFEEPVRDLLPRGVAPKGEGEQITLLDLATQHSGLPGMPDNFQPEDLGNPYADYHAANLYAYLRKRGLTRHAHPGFLYSNLGLGLLGQALANRAGKRYGDLLREEITEPLGMHDTVVRLSHEQRERLIQGYSGNSKHEPVRAWDLDALAGAGAIDSTAGDMLTYLEAQLHPERGGKLFGALTESQRLRADAPGHDRIALAWFYDTHARTYSHNGATAGYSSYAFFYPEGDYAAIVLVNTGPNLILSPDQIGEHIRERLAGKRAVSLIAPVVPGSGGIAGAVRSFAAYWTAVFSAGTFMFCAIITVQGVLQLLPRQVFLRVSFAVQAACFCLLLVVYFVQPPFAGPEALAYHSRLLTWLPSYCFFSAFQDLNGALPSILAPLARRAWIEVATSVCGAAAAYLICYYRTLRKVAETPDILPGARGLRWLPRFGSSLQTAIGQFAIRTLVRSRQHRLILAFYLGIALGLVIFVSKSPVIQAPASETWYAFDSGLLVSSILIQCAVVLGMRIVFSLPLDIRANWIFRVVPTIGVRAALRASRRALYALAVTPVWAVFAIIFFSIWPWRIAAGHLLVLALVAVIAAEASLYAFHKIPFTCSYLPGKSYLHMAGLAFVGLIFGMSEASLVERRALESGLQYGMMIAVLGGVAAFLYSRTNSRADTEHLGLQFDAEESAVILQLGLDRAGARS